jgi:3-hydroxyisobutyrate dehydrogenase
MIGIGQLGLPIATNLMRAGFRVAGYRRSDREAFVSQGGVALDSAADVTREADVLLLCLPSEAAQLDALNGPRGILAALKPGQVVIELGTYRKQFKLEQGALIEHHGGRILEAEVSGSPSMIAERKGALYLGGSAALVEECLPVLEAIAQSRYHLGEYGCAVTVKLIANYLLTIHTLAAAEAINLGARAGFDPALITEVIKHGAGSSAMFAIRGPMMATRRFTPAPGPFTTLEKYLDLAAELAREVGAATPLFSTAAPYFYRGLASDIAAEDVSAVIKLIEADSGPHQGN